MKAISLDSEPTVSIGLIEAQQEIFFTLTHDFTLYDQPVVEGLYRAHISEKMIKLFGPQGVIIGTQKEFLFVPSADDSAFILKNVTIGIEFHWQRREDQIFSGAFKLIASDSGITAVTIVPVETYLRSVISSEMSASCPVELLKAHGIISRSWLFAQREKQTKEEKKNHESEDTIIRWYGREKHTLFDFCADDHCQRYQGIGKVLTSADRAISETRAVVLTYGNEVCDARYSKCCGGFTESFKNTWQSNDVPYLTGLVDYDHFPEGFNLPLSEHKKAEKWISSSPPAYCNVHDQNELLKEILPSFDQETKDFYRWNVYYTAEELGQIIKEKSGIDFGIIHALVPVERGESGRIVRLRIEGQHRCVTVGKELEIRRWLSPRHFYSSAFIVKTKRNRSGKPESFLFRGAGWGHGVGLCQIGAAMMALRGKTYDEILTHYFPHTELKKLY
jgi:stage II sporulation protein D